MGTTNLIKKSPIACKSVVGGWQTTLTETDETFGPIFNSIMDLWRWQKATFGEQVK